MPLSRIQALQNDFAKRTARAGLGKHAAEIDRWRLSLHRGDLTAAREARQRAEGLSATWLDCAACDADLSVDHLLELGDLEGALAAARPLLSWKESCNVVPAATHASLMLALLHAGRREEAQAQHERGYHLVRGERNALRLQALHVQYLALSGQREAAQKTYQANLPFASQKSASPSELLRWHTAAALLGVGGALGKPAASPRSLMPATARLTTRGNLSACWADLRGTFYSACAERESLRGCGQCPLPKR